MRSVTVLAALTGVAVAHAQPESPPRSAAAPDAALAAFPPHPSRDVVVRACAPCHAPELVVAKRRTADEWDTVIATMIDRGAIADDVEQKRILAYLVELFGPAPDARRDEH